jgi:hypothetical protein
MKPTLIVCAGEFSAEGRAVLPQHWRLRPIMKQGTAASIPQTWTHYATLDDAREGAKLMYHNDRVLRDTAV